jgi:phenylpyruvate tautomerase PptA (4-oxalocrotonate tautomerase family)
MAMPVVIAQCLELAKLGGEVITTKDEANMAVEVADALIAALNEGKE